MPFALIAGGKNGGSNPPKDPPDFPLPSRAVGTPPTPGQIEHLQRLINGAIRDAPVAWEILRDVADACRNPFGVRNGEPNRAIALADLMTGHWQSDLGLLDVLQRWADLRKSDRLHVGKVAHALQTRDPHHLTETLAHFTRTFSREQCAELASTLQRLALGKPCKVSTDDDARAGRSRAVSDAFDTLTDQQQTDLAAVIVALAQRNTGNETRNTAQTVRANVLRFIRHVFGTDDYADDLQKIAKTCIDYIAGKGATKHEKDGGD